MNRAPSFGFVLALALGLAGCSGDDGVRFVPRRAAPAPEGQIAAAPVRELAPPHVAAQPTPVPAAAAIVPTAAAREQTLADASQRVSIEMYTASWCSSCAQAKTWLRAQGIAYQEVDIDSRSGARDQLRMLNPRGSIPTFDIEGDVVVGFQPTQIAAGITTAASRHL